MTLNNSQSRGEEIANSISHGFGAVFGIAALFLMLAKSSSAEERACAIIFGLGIIILYTMSTLYHAFRHDSVTRNVFRRFDHLSIYILIGSTYSPIYILVLPKPLGWILLAIQWSLIIVGMVLKAAKIERFAYFHLAMYLLLGWSGVFFFGILYRFSPEAFFLILGGGISYTVGVLFYALHPFKYSHFVWHIFVFVGTLLHFLAIYLFLLA